MYWRTFTGLSTVGLRAVAVFLLAMLLKADGPTGAAAFADEPDGVSAGAASDCPGCGRRFRRRVRARRSHSGADVASNAAPEWSQLHDGKTLTNWNVTDFAGHGEVRVEKGNLVLGAGEGLTGVNWTGKSLPTTNYEVTLEAKRVDGTDFFCGLTFPVAKSHCSFIVGGWGGGVVGLSSIDDFDASENETTQYVPFKDDQWYRIRVQVRPNSIKAWIDDKKLVDQDIKDRKISVRIDVEEALPFGVCSWCTTAAIRDFKIRALPKEEEAATSP